MDKDQSQNDSAIKLKIDSIISTKKFNLFSATIFLLLGVIFLLASNCPSTFLKRNRAHSNPLPSVYQRLGYEEKPFSLSENSVLSIQVNELRSLNKFVTINLTPFLAKNKQAIGLKTRVEISAYTLRGPEIETVIFEKKKDDLTFDCPILEGPCNEEQVINVPLKDVTDFYFVIKFLSPQNLSTEMDGVIVTSVTLSITYRIYIFAVKLFFLLATAGGFFWNSAKMKSFGKDFYNTEQKTFPFLTVILVIVNQPFSIYVFDGVMFSWILTMFCIWLSMSLVWYWCKTTHDLAGAESSLIDQTSKFVKYYTIAYFFVLLITYMTITYKILKEPTAEFRFFHPNFMNLMKSIMIVTLLAGLGWVGYKQRYIYKRVSEIPERENSFYCFSFIFILCHLYSIGKGYLCPVSHDGFGMILFCGASTLYVLATNYAFLPTKEGLGQAEHIKKYDNPAVRDFYKDLEASHSGTPPSGTNTDKSHEQHDDQFHDNVVKDKKVTELYPYEKKDEEEL